MNTDNKTAALSPPAVEGLRAELDAVTAHRARCITERGRFEYALKAVAPHLYEAIREEAYRRAYTEDDHIAFAEWAAALTPAGNGGPTFHCREADDDHPGCEKWCGNHVYCVVSGNIEPKPEREAALAPAAAPTNSSKIDSKLTVGDPPAAGDDIEALRAAMNVPCGEEREAALVSIFRTTGAAMGRHGDAMGWTPEQTANHFIAAQEADRG